jgi:hypothetical protein
VVNLPRPDVVIFIGVYRLYTAVIAKSQDLHFSQFTEIPFLRNPALTEMFNGKARLHSIYRNQWKNIAGTQGSLPYITTGVSGVVKLKGYCMNDPETWTGQVALV